MKFSFKGTHIVVEAENIEENKILVSLNDLPEKTIKGSKEELHKKRKKHQHFKACMICGKVVKGRIGLGIHMSVVHDVKPVTTTAPIQSPLLETNLGK